LGAIKHTSAKVSLRETFADVNDFKSNHGPQTEINARKRRTQPPPKRRNSVKISTVRNDGQTLIPKIIRDYLHLRPGHRIIFTIEPNGQVIVRPIRRDISELEGFLKPPTKPVTLEEMDAVILKGGASYVRH
jgi:AbrB family looped-hinge helix DNA binding protein